jgi:hypothetical protein
MSDAIGPVHIKERPSSEMQSRIDAEVWFWNLGFLGFNNDISIESPAYIFFY